MKSYYTLSAKMVATYSLKIGFGNFHVFSMNGMFEIDITGNQATTANGL